MAEEVGEYAKQRRRGRQLCRDKANVFDTRTRDIGVGGRLPFVKLGLDDHKDLRPEVAGGILICEDIKLEKMPPRPSERILVIDFPFLWHGILSDSGGSGRTWRICSWTC